LGRPGVQKLERIPLSKDTVQRSIDDIRCIGILQFNSTSQLTHVIMPFFFALYGKRRFQGRTSTLH